MYPRLLKIEDIPVYQSFFLFGPRVTGKSTLIRQYLEKFQGTKIVYNLHKHEDYLRLHANPSLLRHEVENNISSLNNEILQVHIDEVQKIPPLLDEVHTLLEEYPKRVRFILSGSSARKLKRGGANLLAGRAWQRHLHPLTSLEIGNAFSFQDALQYGTLPSLVDRPSAEKIEQLRAYVTTYLQEEIQAEALTRRLDAFHRFLEAAALSNGQMVNMTKVAQEASVPRKTVVSYYQILEDTLIGSFLPSWGHRLSRKQLVTHGKFYFFDTGIVSTLNQNLTGHLTHQNPLFGHCFEHFILLEFLRIHDYKGTEHRCGFFRTRAGAEVDLIEEKGDQIRAIEIKAMTSVSKGELSGLQSFAEEFVLAQLIVVCLTPRAYKVGKVLFVPWAEFLRRELEGA